VASSTTLAFLDKPQAEERAKYLIKKYPNASLEERIKYALSS